MKTAVIMTGQARTLVACLPSLHWNLFRKLDDMHIFVSVASEPEASQVEALHDKYPGRVSIEEVEQPILPEPDMGHCYHAAYPITPTKTPGVGPLQGICRQLWHFSRGYRFSLANGLESASTVIRCRFDLHFHRLRLPIAVQPDHFWGPWWGRFGPGVNDRFGVMGQQAAAAYFTTWDVIPEMLDEGCPFHPETMVGESMSRKGICVFNSLCAEFSTQRKDTREAMSVLPGEMAEANLDYFQ
jgi:hypothetical protein